MCCEVKHKPQLRDKGNAKSTIAKTRTRSSANKGNPDGPIHVGHLHADFQKQNMQYALTLLLLIIGAGLWLEPAGS